MSDEIKQLKLVPRFKGEVGVRKEKREKDQGANKWVVFLVLLMTVVVSLIFYFSGRDWMQEPTQTPSKNGGGFFGPKVYRF